MKNKLLYIIFFFLITIITIIIIQNKKINLTEQSIELSTTTVNINVGDTFQINTTNNNLIWTSLNNNIATVDNGIIRGINPGNCIIQVQTQNQKLSKNIFVTVNQIIININKIIINNPDIEIYIGDTTKIDYTIIPNNATDKTLAFNIDDRNIISINENHEIAGLREGNTFITLVSNNGIKEKINITVKKKIVNMTNILLNKSKISIDIGKKEKLIASPLPINTTEIINWKSSNEKIATVNSIGEVLGISSGTATIIATNNNGIEAKCIVTVNEDYEIPITNSINFSKFSNIISCHSESLRYNLINYNGNDLAFIWIKNPSKQLNNALAVNNGNGASSAETILKNEINKYNYHNKCLIAANASFFNMSNGSILANIIISKGNIVRNNGNVTAIGITNKGYINEYINKPLSTLKKDNVLTTFGHSYQITPQNNSNYDNTNRTIICQVNKNNFVLISGSGNPSKLAYDVTTITKVKSCFNLDGGGSRKLYYKTKTSNIIKRFGGSRNIPDMIYFVEE